MTAILLSIKPAWWAMIASGKKTLEIRKSAPDPARFDYEPMQVLVYVSGTRHILGRFTCHAILKTTQLDRLQEKSCVPAAELEAYADGGPLYGWHVADVEQFTEPVPLAELGLTRPPVSWQYIDIPDEAVMEDDGGD